MSGPEVWQPVLVVHEMATDDGPPREHPVRPFEGRVNVRVLVTDDTGAMAGMDARNASPEVAENVVQLLIREHAADVKKILREEPSHKRARRG